MRKQTVMWTALPNGVEGNTLHLSVLVSPRLQTDDAQPTLKLFPDFLHWAAKKLAVTVHFDNGPAVVAQVQPRSPAFALDPALWDAIFKESTYLRPYMFDKYNDRIVHSFPAKQVLGFLKTQYQKIATENPTEFPSTQILGDEKTGFGQISYDWQLFGNPPRRAARPVQREPELEAQIEGRIRKARALPPSFASDPPLDFMQVKLFYRTLNAVEPMTPAKAKMLEKLRKPQIPEFKRALVKVPKYDFHQVVTALGEYPYLMRRLGLVVDVTLPAAGVPPAGRVWVDVKWPTESAAAGVTNVSFSPRTHYKLGGGMFLPAPKGADQLNGFLQLRDPQKPPDQQTYGLIEVDVDGAALKAMNFASNVVRSLATKYKSVDTPEEMSVPSLRSGGICLIRNGNASKIVTSFDTAAKNNGSLENYMANPAGNQPDMSLYAEDVTRGYRIDVRDGSGSWRSLCKRVGSYSVQGIAAPSTHQDEGFVTLAVTSAADKSSPDLYLHESLFRWAGWSLCAPRPGLHLSPQDTLDTQQPFTNESKTEFGVSASFAAAPHSLPRLRFGTHYQLRARAVDLAGNSLSLEAADAVMTPALASRVTTEESFTYGRFEPVGSPVVVLRASVAASPGESVERLVIRSRNVTPADDGKPTAEISERHIAPPLAAQLLAEAHGRFDATGGMNKGAYAVIKSKEGLLETNTIAKESVHPEAKLVLPYLPDPVSRGATFVSLPGAPPNVALPVDFGAATDWPEAKPFVIHLTEGNTKPEWNPATRVLTVRLPKAEVARVRLSSYLADSDLQAMGLWHWIEEKGPSNLASLRQIVREGRHWMLTPFRELVLVHAVQQPLITPQLSEKLASTRNYGETFTRINDIFPISGKSTIKLDFKAKWEEPIDLIAQPAPSKVSRIANAFEVPLAATATEARFVARHDFGDTKYRRVTYQAVATTRFREYFVSAEGNDAQVPLTRTSQERSIDILNSARPAVPSVLYVVPTFAWQKDKSGGSAIVSKRGGGGLRVYLERPWYSSGDGELLGVVLRSTGAPVRRLSFTASVLATKPPDPDDDPLKPYVTQWGADPIWSSNVVGAAPSLDDFRPANAVVKESGLTLEEVPGATVAVAGHAVEYDADRQLWFCDIDIDPGGAYYPFVRLALARYQPKSIKRDGTDVKLSRVVLADFAQLTPDRSVTVTFSPDRKALGVTVAGNAPAESSVTVGLRTGPVRAPIASPIVLPERDAIRRVPGTVAARPMPVGNNADGRNDIDVTVERRGAGDDNDLSWTPEPNAKVVRETPPSLARGAQTLWKGSVTLPAGGELAQYRLVIREYEPFFVDAPDQFGGRRIDRRLVYADAIPL